MSREPLGSDSTSLFGATFQGNLSASPAPMNVRAVWTVSFVWPQAPGAVERYRQCMGPHGGWFAFYVEEEAAPS